MGFASDFFARPRTLLFFGVGTVASESLKGVSRSHMGVAIGTVKPDNRIDRTHNTFSFVAFRCVALRAWRCVRFRPATKRGGGGGGIGNAISARGRQPGLRERALALSMAQFSSSTKGTKPWLENIWKELTDGLQNDRRRLEAASAEVRLVQDTVGSTSSVSLDRLTTVRIKHSQLAHKFAQSRQELSRLTRDKLLKDHVVCLTGQKPYLLSPEEMAWLDEFQEMATDKPKDALEGDSSWDGSAWGASSWDASSWDAVDYSWDVGWAASASVPAAVASTRGETSTPEGTTEKFSKATPTNWKPTAAWLSNSFGQATPETEANINAHVKDEAKGPGKLSSGPEAIENFVSHCREYLEFLIPRWLSARGVDVRYDVGGIEGYEGVGGKVQLRVPAMNMKKFTIDPKRQLAGCRVTHAHKLYHGTTCDGWFNALCSGFLRRGPRPQRHRFGVFLAQDFEKALEYSTTLIRVTPDIYVKCVFEVGCVSRVRCPGLAGHQYVAPEIACEIFAFHFVRITRPAGLLTSCLRPSGNQDFSMLRSGNRIGEESDDSEPDWFYNFEHDPGESVVAPPVFIISHFPSRTPV